MAAKAEVEAPTFCELVDEALLVAIAKRTELGSAASTTKSSAARELSLSITHLEDARMRYVRGIALERGQLNAIDPEVPAGAARMRENFERDNPS